MHVLNFQDRRKNAQHEICWNTAAPNVCCPIYSSASEMRCQDKPIFFWKLQQQPTAPWVCRSPSCSTWPWNEVSDPSPQALTLASVSSTGNLNPSSVKWENSYSSAGMWWWINYLLSAKGSSISLGKSPKPLWIIIYRNVPAYYFFLSQLATTEKLRVSENTGQRPQRSEGVRW